MSFPSFTDGAISQTGGKGTYLFSTTGGVFERIVVISGSSTGFLNVYDSNNGLPLTGAESIVASGVVASGDHVFNTSLMSGLYIEAYGPVNAVVTWR